MHPRSSSISTSALAVIAVVGAMGLVLGAGCSSTTAAADPGVKCTPGNYVFCRCKDRAEGTKLCNEDGHSFGKCDPCETADNPAIPDQPGMPPVEVDGGGDKDVNQPGPAMCGDKVVQDGEDCDDGNKTEDDGCDSTCHLSGMDPLGTRSCPGLDTHVWSKPVTYVGTTKGSTFRGGLSPNCKSDGQNPTSGSAPDRVFNVTAHKTGSMTVATSDTDYDNLIVVTQNCVQGPTPLTYLTCAHNTVGVGGETLTFPVTAGKSYSVLVDGAGITKYEGVFRLTLSIK